MSRSSKQAHSVRNAVLMAALAGLASAVRHERVTHHRGGNVFTRARHVPRIGETNLGEPGEVLWYC